MNMAERKRYPKYYVRKPMIFHNMAEYEEWCDSFENISECENIPVAIDDGWKIQLDMLTKCKSWKVVLRRFLKAFGDVNRVIPIWIDSLEESFENGIYKDIDGWKPSWTDDKKEVAEFAKLGTYGYGLEQLDVGLWYIFLNISGIYAGY